MSNFKVKNADGTTEYIKATGTGTDEDPYILERTLTVDSLPLPTGAATQATLASVLAKLTSDPATATLQGTANTSLASIITALTTLQGYVDGLEGFTDGIEALLGTGNASAANVEPAGSVFAITPHDSTNFSTNARAVYVGVAGNVAIVAPDNSVATFVGVPAGSLLPVKAKRVNSTNTTATSLVGMF